MAVVVMAAIAEVAMEEEVMEVAMVAMEAGAMVTLLQTHSLDFSLSRSKIASFSFDYLIKLTF